MILDSSALVAIALQEPEAESLLQTIDAGSPCGIAAPSLVESGIVIAARWGRDSRPFLDRFLEDLDVETISFGATHWKVALEAWRRFGKGRHEARLNLGDCFSYAAARVAGRPLLCVGEDFALTDLELA